MDSEDNQYNDGSGKRHVKIENKDFYFEVKSNQQGRYMAISEQKGSNRNTILVPESVINEVQFILYNTFYDHICFNFWKLLKIR